MNIDFGESTLAPDLTKLEHYDSVKACSEIYLSGSIFEIRSDVLLNTLLRLVFTFENGRTTC